MRTGAAASRWPLRGVSTEGATDVRRATVSEASAPASTPTTVIIEHAITMRGNRM